MEAQSNLLKSASELDYPPFSLIKSAGQASGFSIELLQAVCNVMRLQVSFAVGPWKEIKQELAEGKLDVLPLMSYSKKRDAVFDFTTPYLRMHGAIFVRKDNTSIHNEKDLKGREVIVMRGDTAHDYAVDNNLSDKLFFADTYLDALRMLSSGKHDAVLMQQVAGRQIIHEFHIKNVVDTVFSAKTNEIPQETPVTEFEQKFCFAVKNGNKALLEKLNTGLNIVTKNGTYESLHNKWFVAPLPSNALSLAKVWQYTLSILIPFLLLFSLAGVYFLRREVKKKTKHLLEEAQERKKFQTALEETKEKYRILFESVIDPVLVADTQTGFIVECNQVAESFFGKTRSQLIGLHQSQLQSGNNTPPGKCTLSEDFKKLCEHPELPLELQLCCAQNKTRLVSVQVATFMHMNQNLMLGVFRDITEQKKMLDALNKSEKLLLKAQRIAHLGHWELDLTQNKLTWSEEIYHIFGVAPGGQAITYEDFLSCVHPEDRQAVDNAYSKSVQEKCDGYEITHRVIRKNDGALRYVQEKCKHVTNGNGEVVCSVGTILDTTEQNVIELKLREALHNAEAANKSKAVFLANMSHEIRTPLNGIIGMLQLLQFEFPTPQQREYIIHALNSGKRLTNLLSDILDLSRVDAGMLAIRSAPFNLNEVIQSVSQLFIPAIRQKGLNLNICLAPSVPANLRGDALRLQQVLSNILGNAVKFTESGNIAIEVFPLTAANPAYCNLLFSISDEGIGIPAEKLDVLFDAFEQAENSYTRKFQGAGLGLSISKNLINLMGGSITAESTPGAGTSFQFCIPLEVLPPQSPNNLPEKTTQEFSPFNILLAEDDAVSQRTITGLLDKMGQRVRVVENGAQALIALKKEFFDLVFMDIQMPVMEGLEATRAIRAGKAGEDKKNIPIVAVTAYAMGGDKDTFLEAGMNDYISKPIHYEAVEGVLARFTQKRRKGLQ